MDKPFTIYLNCPNCHSYVPIEFVFAVGKKKEIFGDDLNIDEARKIFMCSKCQKVYEVDSLTFVSIIRLCQVQSIKELDLSETDLKEIDINEMDWDEEWAKIVKKKN